MTDLSAQVLAKIKAHRIEAIPLEDDMTLPFYDGLSLVNVPGTISNLLGAPGFGKQPLDAAVTGGLLDRYEKIVMLVVDALGYTLFEKLRARENGLAWAKHFEQAIYSPITSICPSTTASALTTLWTGEGPSVHGIIGYEMWAKEFGMVINNIRHNAASSQGDTGGLDRSGFDPYEFMNRPLLGMHLRNNGVGSTAFIHSAIGHSGLSTMQMRDVNLQTYVDEADLCVSLVDYVNSRRGIREFIYVYYSDIDTLIHRYSAHDKRIAFQFEAFSKIFEQAFLNNLSETVAKDALLILIADHGSVATPKYSRYDLANHPEFYDNLVMQPTCENRLAFFYIKPGRMAAVRDYFEDHWPEDFILLEPGDALEHGLFGNGPFHGNARERLGDLIAVSRKDAYLWWAPKPNPLAGRHGGLNDEEMLVPFYALPLSGLR